MCVYALAKPKGGGRRAIAPLPIMLFGCFVGTFGNFVGRNEPTKHHKNTDKMYDVPTIIVTKYREKIPLVLYARRDAIGMY